MVLIEQVMTKKSPAIIMIMVEKESLLILGLRFFRWGILNVPVEGTRRE
jgi:hypothetical protein